MLIYFQFTPVINLVRNKTFLKTIIYKYGNFLKFKFVINVKLKFNNKINLRWLNITFKKINFI